MHRVLLALFLITLVAPGCGGDDPSPDNPNGGGDAPRAEKIPLDTWSQVAVPGFKQMSGKVAKAGAMSTYQQEKKTAGGATLQVRVTFSPCAPSTCESLEPDASRDHMRLRRHLNRKHASNPKLVWDAGHIDFAGGRKGLYLYTRSYMEEKQGGGTRRLTAHFFQAWYHDGKHLIDFAVDIRGGKRVTSDADLAAQMTKDEATKAVQAIFTSFQGAF